MGMQMHVIGGGGGGGGGVGGAILSCSAEGQTHQVASKPLWLKGV